MDVLNANTAADSAVASIAAAGAHAVKADDRTIQVTAKIGDVEVTYPYAFRGNGEIALFEQVVAAAKAEHARRHPDRAGKYRMHDLASVLAWAKRYGGPESAAYVSAPDPDTRVEGSVLVIADDTPAAGPDGGRRALSAGYQFSLHPRLQSWFDGAGDPHAVAAFAELIDRAADELSNAELASAVNNIEVKEESTWKRQADADSGKIRLLAEDTQQVSKVPRTFQFAVPVFEHDQPGNVQTFQARLKVTVERGKPVFSYELLDFALRLGEAVAQVVAEVGAVVPQVYMGAP